MDNGQLECRVCGVVGPHKIYMGREMQFGSRELFEYFACGACGCLQIRAIPENLQQYYPADYYSHSDATPVRRPSYLRHLLEKQRCRTALFGRGFKISKLIKGFTPLPQELHENPGRVVRRAGLNRFDQLILDVGCGASATWLRMLANLGFTRLTGIDPFIAHDLSHGRIRVLKRHITEIEGQFDLVTMHHSLEHMPDQAAALSAARNLLRADGILVVRIPIFPSSVWDRYGVNWVGMDSPRHLYLHSIKSLEMLAERAGFRHVDIEYDSWAFNWWASEQYERDIPLVADNSHWRHPENSVFTSEQVADFARRADKANGDRNADQAAFYFRPN